MLRNVFIFTKGIVKEKYFLHSSTTVITRNLGYVLVSILSPRLTEYGNIMTKVHSEPNQSSAIGMLDESF